MSDEMIAEIRHEMYDNVVDIIKALQNDNNDTENNDNNINMIDPSLKKDEPLEFCGEKISFNEEFVKKCYELTFENDINQMSLKYDSHFRSNKILKDKIENLNNQIQTLLMYVNRLFSFFFFFLFCFCFLFLFLFLFCFLYFVSLLEKLKTQ